MMMEMCMEGNVFNAMKVDAADTYKQNMHITH